MSDRLKELEAFVASIAAMRTLEDKWAEATAGQEPDEDRGYEVNGSFYAEEGDFLSDANDETLCAARGDLAAIVERARELNATKGGK